MPFVVVVVVDRLLSPSFCPPVLPLAVAMKELQGNRQKLQRREQVLVEWTNGELEELAIVVAAVFVVVRVFVVVPLVAVVVVVAVFVVVLASSSSVVVAAAEFFLVPRVVALATFAVVSAVVLISVVVRVSAAVPFVSAVALAFAVALVVSVVVPQSVVVAPSEAAATLVEKAEIAVGCTDPYRMGSRSPWQVVVAVVDIGIDPQTNT